MKADLEEIKVPLHDDLDTKPGIDWKCVELTPKKAPRVPRQIEPAPLWWVLAMVVFVGTFLGLLLGCGAHAAVASVELVVGWLRGVLP
jgi:hypothetical protein